MAKKSILCTHRAGPTKPKIMVVWKVRPSDGQRFGFFVCGECYLPKENTLAITRSTCELCLARFLSPLEKKCRACHKEGVTAADLSHDQYPWHGWLWLSERLRGLYPGLSQTVHAPVGEIAPALISPGDLENLVDSRKSDALHSLPQPPGHSGP